MGRDCWSTRWVVEQCLFLPIESFSRWGTLSNPSGTTGTLSWTSSRSGAEQGKLEYFVQADENGLAIHVRRQFARLYGAAKLIEECTIPITTTTCRFGGERFWFRCPFVRDGKICGKRIGRLYLPPGQAVFGCRTCHNLIHRSAREHDARRNALMRDPVALAAALGDKKLARRLVALGALVRRLKTGESGIR
jgi:hypothetical protein